MRGGVAGETGRLVQVSTVVCLAGAVLVVIGAAVMGRPAAGAALAVGMVMGAANGHIARRLFNLGVPFGLTSMLRISLLTAIAVAVGAIFGFGHVFLVVLGLGIAQLIMAASALRELNRR
jgi:hypothetical protein